MTDSASSRWSTVSEDIVDDLVNHLKRTKRWSRDGRSCRALNKHWCVALNKHIVEVRPRSYRVVREDLDSLSKFTNLSELDAGPFEGGLADRRETCVSCWRCCLNVHVSDDCM